MLVRKADCDVAFRRGPSRSVFLIRGTRATTPSRPLTGLRDGMASSVPISPWPTIAPIREPSPRWFRLAYPDRRGDSGILLRSAREVMTVSAAKKKVAVVANPRVDMYETLIATIPGLERKGDANP